MSLTASMESTKKTLLWEGGSRLVSVQLF